MPWTGRGPLADRYAGAVALVLLALTPYLVLTTALQPLQQLIAKDLGMSARSLQLTSGMANAAYAVGAVIAVQVASRLRPRRMLLAYALLFVLGSVAVAAAKVPGIYIAGHVVQGLATGLLLIASVPPLVLSWGPDKLPRTVVVMNLGIFGATALGPVVGGIQAGAMHWRPLLWIVAALGAGALLLAVLTYEDAEPQDPDAPVDIIALVLATAGCGLAFFGVSELMGRRATDTMVLLPVIAGVALLVVMVVHQWLSDDPLIPVRKLAHTVPLAAIVTAMAAGAASVAAVQLTQVALQARGVPPAHAGRLFIPELCMALVAAVLFGRLVRTRYTAFLAGADLLALGAGAIVLTGTARGSDALVLIGSALVGIGVGSCVSPALFLAGFSLQSHDLPRVFAYIELLRGVAAFLAGPALLQLAMAITPQADGLRASLWVAAGLALLGFLIAGTILVLGRFRPQEPDVERWMDDDGPAISSQQVADAVRS